jgi:hypothetical protein
VGNTRLLWTTVIADLLIGLSCVAISTTLARKAAGAYVACPREIDRCTRF